MSLFLVEKNEAVLNIEKCEGSISSSFITLECRRRIFEGFPSLLSSICLKCEEGDPWSGGYEVCTSKKTNPGQYVFRKCLFTSYSSVTWNLRYVIKSDLNSNAFGDLSAQVSQEHQTEPNMQMKMVSVMLSCQFQAVYYIPYKLLLLKCATTYHVPNKKLH